MTRSEVTDQDQGHIIIIIIITFIQKEQFKLF